MTVMWIRFLFVVGLLNVVFATNAAALNGNASVTLVEGGSARADDNEVYVGSTRHNHMTEQMKSEGDLPANVRLTLIEFE